MLVKDQARNTVTSRPQLPPCATAADAHARRVGARSWLGSIDATSQVSLQTGHSASAGSHVCTNSIQGNARHGSMTSPLLNNTRNPRNSEIQAARIARQLRDPSACSVARLGPQHVLVSNPSSESCDPAAYPNKTIRKLAARQPRRFAASQIPPMSSGTWMLQIAQVAQRHHAPDT